MARRTYVISDALVEWVDDFAGDAEIEKSEVVEIALAAANKRMERAWEKAGKPKGAMAIHALLQAVSEESIKSASAKRRS